MAPTGYFLQKETKATKGDGLTVDGGWLGRRPPSLTSVRKAFVGTAQSGVPMAPTGYFLQEETKATKADGLTVGGW